ncbi:MAG TPA: transporter substrate-binding domain-containing protein [Vicinamibacteria bacterium]|nr:transporter substrate-binding domain-containing protein [Vicinamibacteria bacterium]
MRRIKSLALSSLASVLFSYCGASEEQASLELAQQEAPAPADQEEIPPPPEPEPLPPGLAPIAEPWTGDLPGMAERRVVRFLVVQSPVLYFVDKGRELGLTYESIKAFEEHLNESLGSGHVKVHAVPVPVSRGELIPKLLSGEGDIAAATLTVTPDRLQQVDFSDPLARDIAEVVVSGAGSAPVSSLDELSGKEVHVRLSSSYAEHLEPLNDRLVSEGKAPIEIVPADEILEDGDLIEMVAAGLIPATVADSFIAELWKEVFPGIVLHADAPVSTGGDIAWAFRKDSPELAKMVNTFVKSQKQGTLMGNMLIKKYLKTTKWLKNARSEEDIARFRSMVALFQKYAAQYDFDWLLMVAQGYQESGLDQSKRSHVGAIGVMQVMPATARDQAVDIPDIENLESNIHAGIKYNRWVADNFFGDESIRKLDRALFSFASYNAGPGRVRSLRREAEEQGLDPNRWFNNVELIAAKRIGRETVQYVSNIYKYYIAYQLILRQEERREKARVSGGP